MRKDPKIFECFENHDRFDFPIDVERVTAGRGCEVLLIFGSDKTALMECGMAYCGKKTVENIKNALTKHKKADGSDYTLDYIFASHTHYDHIGAMPYIVKAFPNVTVFGSEKGQYIFTRPGALKVIKSLGESARDQYDPGNTDEIPVDGLRIDVALKEGDKVSLGNEEVIAMETKGHTDCSMTYIIEPLGIMFCSESTGVMERDMVNTPILKSYDDCIVSVEKCKNYGAKYVVTAHYGILPCNFNDEYWETFIRNANEKRTLVKEWYGQGLSDEEVLEKYTDVYWNQDIAQEQPKEAFMINAKNIVKVLGQ